MVVWSVLVLAAVVVLAEPAVPDPPDIGASRQRVTAVVDCTGIVAFSATQGINDNSRVVHANLLVDKGSGYSTQTGIFTANCSGLYQFSFAGYGSADLRLTLKRKPGKNGSWRSVVGTGPGGGANTILLDIDVGDQLAVFVESGKLRDGSTFTGFRINFK